MTDAAPKNRNVEDDFSADTVEIREGTATMLYAKNEEVFYNKVQVFNRDISIQVIRLFSETIAEERKERFEKAVARHAAIESKVTTRQDSVPVGANNFNQKLPPMPPPPGISILDALAATGLRSVRYLKEIPNVRELTINDLSPDATASAAENCKVNGIEIDAESMSSNFAGVGSKDGRSEPKVSIVTGDACMLMYERSRMPSKGVSLKYDVIDLDPYGTAAPFLDSAVQAVTNGGLLCVTCTDTAILNGNFPEVCFSKYGTVSIKAKYMHEMGLRILLNSIETAANRYQRYIVPWVSISVDFYVRVFVRVFESQAEVKKSLLKRMMVYQSVQCPSFYIQPLGSHSSAKDGSNVIPEGKTPGGVYTAGTVVVPSVCEATGGRLRVGGPFWGQPLHDPLIVQELLRRVKFGEVGSKDLPFEVPTAKRIVGVLTAISEELPDVPLFYHLSELASALQTTTPTGLQIRAALQNAGYRVSQFHHEPMAVKTDAPPDVVWDIMREYCRQFPTAKSAKKKVPPSLEKIMSQDSKIKVNFKPSKALFDQLNLQRGKGPGAERVARFPMNPEANWGPKSRAGRKASSTVSAASASVNGAVRSPLQAESISSSNSNSNINSSNSSTGKGDAALDSPPEKKAKTN